MPPILNDDRELTREQVQSLSSAAGVANLFAYLGYPVDDSRLPMTADALALNAELTRATQRIERLASLEVGALEIYLFELKAVTVAHTRNLARAFRDRAGDYLLVLTDDYARLDFVLLERVLPEPGSKASAARRPRVLTVNRRDPGAVSLRVLRRFSLTEADSDGLPDPYAQFEKLRSAYVVAEWSEPLFNNRALFSDYYLNERLPTLPEWNDPQRNAAFHQLRQQFAAARRRFSGQPGDKIRADLIRPLLQTLGFTVETPPTADNAPDFQLNHSQFTIQNSPFILAYPWNRYLDGKSDSDPERPDDNPGARAVSLLEAGAGPWAIVTNGKVWRLYSAQAHSRATNYYEIDLEETLASPAPAEAFRYFYLFFRAEAFTPRRSRLQRDESAAASRSKRDLQTSSFLDWLLAESGIFAKELGERLKERVFEEIFPHLAEGFIHGLGGPDKLLALPEAERTAQLEEVFQATLTLLYRLLFVLYAESRDLLPVRELRGYHDISLQKLREELAAAGQTLEDEAPTRLRQAYRADETGLYERLQQLFRVIDQGDAGRNVPIYNGGLFITTPSPQPSPSGRGSENLPPSGGERGGESAAQTNPSTLKPDPGANWGDSPEQRTARFLAETPLPDRFLALGLDRLSRDIDPRRGDLVFIDYKSLGVRQLGSIYEGLLEFKVRLAPGEMAVVKGKKTEEVIPVSELPGSSKTSGKLRTLSRGAVYLENDRRERKASGSYYTPDYIVKYIVQHTVGPVLDEKFAALRPRLETLGRRFHTQLKNKQAANVIPNKTALLTDMGRDALADLFDLKVLDPAMGSGHFLVEAVDFITDRLVRFIAGFPFLSHFFEGMRRDILAEMERQAITLDPGRLTDVTLLKRHVLKRCIYGVDLNMMAVELAKVSLWLDCFTLGAPLSFLDHHLRWGNSLIGASARTAEADFGGPADGGQMTFFTGPFAGLLQAAELMRGVSLLTDVTLTEVHQSAQLFRQFDDAAKPYKQLLDVMVARHFGVKRADEFLRLYGVDALKAGPDSVGEPYRTALLDTRRLFAAKRFFHWDLEFPEVFIDLGRATWKADGGFDAVIGNPPYVRVRTLKDSNDTSVAFYESGVYSSAVHVWDIYMLFGERALGLARNDGYCAFIIPIQTLHQPNGEALRSLLVSAANLREIVDLNNLEIFDEAIVKTCILAFSPTGDGENNIVQIRVPIDEDIEHSKAFEVAQKKLGQLPGYSFKPDLLSNLELLEKIDSVSQPLGDIFYVTFGLRSSARGKGRGGKERLILEAQTTKNARPYMEGREIARYSEDWQERFIDYLPDEMYSSRTPDLFEVPKIVSQSMLSQKRLIATADYEFKYVEQSLVCIVPYKETEEKTTPSELSLKAILALINSQLASFYFATKIIGDSLGGGLIHATPGSQIQIPIRRIDFTTPAAERAERLAGLVALYRQGPAADASLLAEVETLLNSRSRLQRDTAPDGNTSRSKRDLPAAEPIVNRKSKIQNHTDVIHDLLAHLAGQMIDLNQQKQAGQKQYFESLEAALRLQPDKEGRSGLDTLSGKTYIQGYLGDYQKDEPETGWGLIEDTLFKNKRRVGANLNDTRLIARLRTEYEQSLAALRPLKSQLARTDALIDRIVYRLYGLTEDEIAVVEGKA